jgi:hypothetical protein
MGLNKREITLIASANQGNFSVKIAAVGGGLWGATIKIFNPENSYDVFTARGALKTWRDLGDAITFIQQACGDCKDVSISIGEWEFSRVV